MKQYFAIFRVPVATMEQWMTTTSPEERQAQGQKLGQDMQAWMSKHKDALVGSGWPLGKTKTVSASGTVDARNDLNYAIIVQAESHEAAAAIMAESPHTTIPDSTIDVMEISNMQM
jgi:hypothetical protein